MIMKLTTIAVASIAIGACAALVPVRRGPSPIPVMMPIEDHKPQPRHTDTIDPQVKIRLDTLDQQLIDLRESVADHSSVSVGAAQKN